jgi:hypothetical protein
MVMDKDILKQSKNALNSFKSAGSMTVGQRMIEDLKKKRLQKEKKNK